MPNQGQQGGNRTPSHGRVRHNPHESLKNHFFTQRRVYVFSNRNRNSRFGSSASLSHSLVHFMPAMTFFL